MKISAREKERVRAGIVRSAERLFRKHGFAAATTRQIATAAGVAAGTVFNYFPTKDDLGLALIRGHLVSGEQEYNARRRGDESLAEDLFAYLWSCLKQLRAQRVFAGDVLQRASLPGQPQGGDGPSSQLPLLGPVTGILARHGATATGVDMHLFSALLAGVVSFWSRDKSKDQEDTMVVVDRSMRLFADHILKETLGNEIR